MSDQNLSVMGFFDEFTESSGRVNRQGFAVRMLAAILLVAAFGLSFTMVVFGGAIFYFGMLVFFYLVGSVIGNAIARRFHDLGVGGWYMGPVAVVLTILTILSLIPALILLIPTGQKNVNKYGPPPQGWRGSEE